MMDNHIKERALLEYIEKAEHLLLWLRDGLQHFNEDEENNENQRKHLQRAIDLYFEKKNYNDLL